MLFLSNYCTFIYSYFIIIKYTRFLYTSYAPLFVLVVDVYQSYGGPCKAMEAKFRAIKNTLGDPILFFAIVSQCEHICFSYYIKPIMTLISQINY